jgi:hypothetical protein
LPDFGVIAANLSDSTDFGRNHPEMLAAMLRFSHQVLNHVERGITRVYDRHSYDPEKRQALQAWGDFLGQLVSS